MSTLTYRHITTNHFSSNLRYLQGERPYKKGFPIAAVYKIAQGKSVLGLNMLTSKNHEF